MVMTSRSFAAFEIEGLRKPDSKRYLESTYNVIPAVRSERNLSTFGVIAIESPFRY
jgi:hypothetical protein